MKYKKLPTGFFKGFTLVEVLVVAAITGIITTAMVLNFQRTRADLNRSKSILIADLRSTQSKALASTKFDSGTGPKIRCGYGIHYLTPSTYLIYTGPDASTLDCKLLNRNYGIGDFVVASKIFEDTNVEFKSVFDDIFWEPPFPYTYLNNSSTSAPFTITIGKKGGICPGDCKTINVSTTGKIE